MNPNLLYSLTESFLLENNCYSEVTTQLLDGNTTLWEICKEEDSVNVACVIYLILGRISENMKWVYIRDKWYNYAAEHKLW